MEREMSYGEWLSGILAEKARVYESTGELAVELSDGSVLLDVMRVLRDQTNCQYKQIVDITAVDEYGRAEGRQFKVVYQMLSVRYSRRLRVECMVAEGEGLESVRGLYEGANWLEREVWEMFGVEFRGHGDLRRLLTDYGFKGYPMRKDFPLSGYVEVRYDERRKGVVTERLELGQELRNQ